ncbi:hypothetical protein HanRHA438_Chr13g0602121 [Helianthus annuus]|nr:hypothetical protein HanRHA438_Chr13g0602121 [Helianthus annuus]
MKSGQNLKTFTFLCCFWTKSLRYCIPFWIESKTINKDLLNMSVCCLLNL